MVDPILTYFNNGFQYLSILSQGLMMSHDVSWLGWFGPPMSSRTPPNLRPAWDCRRSMDWCRWQLGIAAMIPEPTQRSQWKCVAPFASQVSHIHSFRLTVVWKSTAKFYQQNWSFRKIIEHIETWHVLTQQDTSGRPSACPSCRFMRAFT